MKYLLILSLSLSFAYSQTVNGVNITDSTHIGYVLISKGQTFRDGDYLDIDYGQKRTELSKEFVEVDGERKQFHSLIEIFNFMHASGWEFVMQIQEAETGTLNSLLDKKSDNVVIKYMFRRITYPGN